MLNVAIVGLLNILSRVRAAVEPTYMLALLTNLTTEQLQRSKIDLNHTSRKLTR